MKVKSPSSGGKDFSAMGVPEAFVGKGPGRSGQPTGEGCEETRDISFLLSSPNPGTAHWRCKAQGLWVKGQVKNP